MSPERLEQLQQTTLLIGGSLCGFVFIGIVAMCVAALYYNKKGNK